MLQVFKLPLCCVLPKKGNMYVLSLSTCGKRGLTPHWLVLRQTVGIHFGVLGSCLDGGNLKTVWHCQQQANQCR